MFSNTRSGSKKKNSRLGGECFSLALAVALIFQFGCSNLFTTFATTDDDESQYISAQKDVDKGNYASAIASCELISANYLTRPDVAITCASAYAGRCGFSTLGMIDDLDTYFTTPPAENLFHWLLTQINGTTATNVSDCNSAITIINNVGRAATRSTDLNVFSTLLSIYTMGVVLNETGDVTDDDALDGGFDACAISNANAQVAGFSFWELNESLTELSADPDYNGVFLVVDSLCTLLSGESLDLCAASAATAPSSLTAAELNGARSLFKEGFAVGVDQCGGGLPISPGCKCP